MVRFISEKRNCLRRSRGMREFPDVIEDLKLIDIQREDNKFTWFKGDNQNIASRIDRILFSEEWDESVNNLKQMSLQRLGSHHSPIALQGVWNKNKNYFKFENGGLAQRDLMTELRSGGALSSSLESRISSLLPCLKL